MRGYPAGRQYEVVTAPNQNSDAEMLRHAWCARVEITEESTIEYSAATLYGATREDALEKATAWCREHEAEIVTRRSQVKRHQVSIAVPRPPATASLPSAAHPGALADGRRRWWRRK